MSDPTEKPAVPAKRSDEDSFIEKAIEFVLFNSRWLLAPFYLALVAALAIMMLKMLRETWKFVLHSWTATDIDIILGVLSLIDLTLTGSLIIIVVFSGYENFVSKIDAAEHRDWPDWMAKIDFTGLKLKLLSSIVAISAIKLLTAFMNIGKYSDRDLIWLTAVHVTFVVSGLLMAWTDRISGEKH